MARRRLPNYKLVNAATKDMGSAGAQVLMGHVYKTDAQGIPNGYFNNIKLSWLMSDVSGSGDSDANFGAIFYLTTTPWWSDDTIISAAAAGNMSGTVYLSGKRRITTNAVPDGDNDIGSGTGGMIYLWGECSDSTVTADVDIRYVAETFGRYVEFASD